jgi:hypothetical protein
VLFALRRLWFPLLACLLGLNPAFASTASARETGPGERLVVAHYYAWWDMNVWRRGETPDYPAQLYASADRVAMARQVDQAVAAGIDVFNLAWLGPQNPTDANFQQMLPIAAERGLAMTVGVEMDSPFMTSRATLRDAIRYAIDRYGYEDGYLRYEGRPVLMFWRVAGIPLSGERNAVAAWRSLRDEVDPNHETLWIAEGDRFEFLEVFDGIYPYSIAWSRNVASTLASYGNRTRAQAAALGTPKLWVATVMPGYDDTTTGRADAFTRDRRNGDFYEETWNAAVASRADWISITTWNEWVEGSHIEPSRAYGPYYLELTRDYAGAWKGVDLRMAGSGEPTEEDEG